MSDNSTKPTLIQAGVAYVQARLITIAVWTAIILAIYIGVSVNRANEAATEAKLSSASQQVRDSEVRQLALDGNLADALANTEDPSGDSSSPQNKESLIIRRNAATSLDSLVANNKIATPAAITALFSLTKDSDATVKASGENGLAALAAQSAGNLHTIIVHLSDGDPDLRSAAVDVLGHAANPDLATTQTAEQVVKVVKDPAAQDSALAALTKIGKPAAPVLEPLIDDPLLTFREQIISILGQIGNPQSTPALLTQATLNPPVPPVRRVALIALSDVVIANIPAPSTTAAAPAGSTTAPTISPADMSTVRSAEQVLEQAVSNQSDDGLARARAALALGRIATPRAVAVLVGALGDLDMQVRSAALNGVQSVGAPAVGALSVALGSSDPTVQAAAASALGSIDSPQALSAVSPALAHGSDNVREAAAQALGNSGNVAATSLLIARLSDPNGFVAEAAADSLHLLGAKAIPALVDALGSKDATAAFYASRALHDAGADAVPELIDAAKSATGQKGTWLAVTLGAIHDPRSVDALNTLKSSGDAQTQWAAQQALNQMSGTDS